MQVLSFIWGQIVANFLFYFMTVLIWGSTWLAIKFQLGVVSPAVSITYRFALAAIMLFAWSLITRRTLRFSRSEHLFMALQGSQLFALNYLFFYLAELELTSGLAAVVFSTRWRNTIRRRLTRLRGRSFRR